MRISEIILIKQSNHLELEEKLVANDWLLFKKKRQHSAHVYRGIALISDKIWVLARTNRPKRRCCQTEKTTFGYFLLTAKQIEMWFD